jgi:hypothetical protein
MQVTVIGTPNITNILIPILISVICVFVVALIVFLIYYYRKKYV